VHKSKWSMIKSFYLINQSLDYFCWCSSFFLQSSSLLHSSIMLNESNRIPIISSHRYRLDSGMYSNCLFFFINRF
jgi:hypothetical protein